MSLYPRWQYNEMQQVGTDFTDEAQVEAYDQRMQRWGTDVHERRISIDDVSPGSTSSLICNIRSSESLFTLCSQHSYSGQT